MQEFQHEFKQEFEQAFKQEFRQESLQEVLKTELLGYVTEIIRHIRSPEKQAQIIAARPPCDAFDGWGSGQVGNLELVRRQRLF